MFSRLAILVWIALAVAGCRPAQEETSIDVTVVVDGREETYGFARDLSVDQVLDSANIELGPRDRISHPLVSRVSDGMLITIRRVSEKRVCIQQEVAFERRYVLHESIKPAVQQLAQTGVTGIEEACYRVTLEDKIEVEQILLADPTIVQAPIHEIIYTGPVERAEPVAITGRLSYINHGNPWTIEGNTVNKRQLADHYQLDSLVYDQSEDGSWLLFTAETESTDDFFNELWILGMEEDRQPLRVTPTDVLYAEWRPRAGNAIAYSTGERSNEAPGWKALNNLWLMTVDLDSGRTLTIDEALPESAGGLYGWWGTHFAWSPYGDQMAWTRPDGFGLVDLERKRRATLAEYAVFHSATSWIWLSTISWSFDNQLIASIVHGAPVGDEPAETSPVFDLTVSSADGRIKVAVRRAAGMWASPKYSPDYSSDTAEQREGYLAWLQAREPDNSGNSEYDLIVADRDGSNQRILFPAPGKAGILKRDLGLTANDFAWSPDARMIALIYQGNLWLVDVTTRATYQVSFDGASSNPVWTG